MISSILIPTDFSPASWKATQLGLDFARLNSSTSLSFLHVYPMRSKYSHENYHLAIPEKMEEVKNRMNHLAKDFLDNPDEQIKNVVLSGNVEDTMLQFIKENNFDLVILGINGNGFDNNVGSHTLSILQKSDTPVMVIPNNVRVNGVSTS